MGELVNAVNEGNIKKIRELINNGININERNYSWRTALMVAIMYRENEIAKLLIELGADINAKDAGGWTPLMMAVDDNNIELIKVLINAGVDVNAKDNYGWTALMWVVNGVNKTNNLEVVKLLVDLGADINTKDADGKTVIDLTIERAKEYKLKNNIKEYEKCITIINYLSTELKKEYDKQISSTIIGSFDNLSL